MSINITVPELGESVVEATIVRWFKSVGDAVRIGDALVELETEKANFEIAAEKEGVLSSILKG
ncbi:MAG TPA: biotin/lipoyl-containing protein, partial [Thermodesulfobacteriota bacterium]|nr:biotin/lipoyl-containing protein [Thermodesulfobacteriota bacterium]